MAFVKCSVGGCSRRLQSLLKVDPRDRDTWFYPECEEHSSGVDGRVVCDRCRTENEEPTRLLSLGLLG